MVASGYSRAPNTTQTPLIIPTHLSLDWHAQLLEQSRVALPGHAKCGWRQRLVPLTHQYLHPLPLDLPNQQQKLLQAGGSQDSPS
jgi:hypothetical protein